MCVCCQTDGMVDKLSGKVRLGLGLGMVEMLSGKVRPGLTVGMVGQQGAVRVVGEQGTQLTNCRLIQAYEVLAWRYVLA